MKVNTRVPHLACLASFTLFALSTPAQNQAIQLPANIHPLPTVANARESTPASGKTQQEEAKSDGVSSDATTSCAYTFTTGSGPTYMKFCVTVNGNITQFESPAGNEQINVQKVGEGYGLCALNLTTGNANSYWDYGETASTNWGPPTLLSLTATEVKIERTTSDGNWTLTQTITQIGGSLPYAKVEMQLKYNSATPNVAPFFVRWVNVDASDTTRNNLDYTAYSAWGYVHLAYGLMMQGVSPGASFLFSGITFDTPSPAESGLTSAICNEGSGTGGPFTNTDGSMALAYGGLLSTPKDYVYTMTFKYKAY
jgi:hypothetical protein